jgi:hypothetical protein
MTFLATASGLMMDNVRSIAMMQKVSSKSSTWQSFGL